MQYISFLNQSDRENNYKTWGKQKEISTETSNWGWSIWQRKMILRPSSMYHDSSLPQISKAGSIRIFVWPVGNCFWQICVLHPFLCQHCSSPIFQQCCLCASLHSAIFSVLPTHPMLKHSSCNSLPHPSLPSAAPPVTQGSSAFFPHLLWSELPPTSAYFYVLSLGQEPARASVFGCQTVDDDKGCISFSFYFGGILLSSLFRP